MRMPEPLPGNKLFLVIMNDCTFGRDFNGRVDMGVFIEVMNIYVEILELDAWDKLELIRKVRTISSVEENKRETKKKIGDNKSTTNMPKILKGKR